MSEDVEARPTAASASVSPATAESATPAPASGSATSTAPATVPAAEVHHEEVPPQTRYHHGASPAGWAGALPALVGVFIAAIGGTIPHFHPVIFGIGAALFVCGGIAAIVMRALGLGND